MVFIMSGAWKVIDLIISYLATQTIPYLGFFPYRELLYEYKLPQFIASFANFDGAQYLTLVREGYNTYTQAYFPLYFLVVKTTSLLFPMFNAARPNNDLLAGLYISNGFFIAGLFIFKKYLNILFPKNKRAITWIILFLLWFPTSFFFGAVYTEGLFFFLFVGSLYFLKKQNYLLAGLFAALSSATRLVGIFVIVPFLLNQISKINNQKHKPTIKDMFVFTPLLGLVAYMIYLWRTVGDPLFFFHSQPVFGANRSTHLILLPQVYYRYLKIFVTAQFNFQYFISIVEVLIFTFVFIVLCLDMIRQIKNLRSARENQNVKDLTLISLNVFSFINLILPTLTGTFSSVPRYALFSISLFLYLGTIKNKALQIMFLCVFFFLHVILLGFFIQGYFVG